MTKKKLAASVKRQCMQGVGGGGMFLIKYFDETKTTKLVDTKRWTNLAQKSVY